MKTRVVFCGLLLCFAVAAGTADGADRGIKIRNVLGEDLQLPDYHALVIGVNRYKHWRSLRQAREDAQNVASLLRSRYGFKAVTTLYDEQASLEGIIRELRVLTRKLTPNDSLLIYFAGHGYYDKLMKKGYWIPSEGREEAGGMPAINDWLQNSNLKEYTDAMKARHVLVVSDSCFSGAMLRGGRIDIETKQNTWYRRAISQPTRWCVASGDLETVPDQSIFAKKFLQTLQYPRQSVFAASDLAGWIKGDVAAYSGRRPVFGPMNTASGSELGEFIFLVHDDKPAARTPAPAPVAKSMLGPVLSAPKPKVTQPAPKAARVRYGGLEVKSPVDAVIQINGGKGYSLAAGKTLRWEKMSVGTHAIQATSGVRSWTGVARVFEGRTATMKAFPDEERRLAEEARQRALAEKAAAAAEARKQGDLERLLKEQASTWEQQTKEPEPEKKKRRPRVH
ncbi:MAG: caspase family protein [Kiritimatiellae bacterium]|nr:caspase family protein [Kiritimatiellia bacterium]